MFSHAQARCASVVAGRVKGFLGVICRFLSYTYALYKYHISHRERVKNLQGLPQVRVIT